MHKISFPVTNPPPTHPVYSPMKYRACLEDVQIYERNFLACKGKLEGPPQIYTSAYRLLRSGWSVAEHTRALWGYGPVPAIVPRHFLVMSHAPSCENIDFGITCLNPFQFSPHPKQELTSSWDPCQASVMA